jgi:hypothetical protein
VKLVFNIKKKRISKDAVTTCLTLCPNIDLEPISTTASLQVFELGTP